MKIAATVPFTVRGGREEVRKWIFVAKVTIAVRGF